ncbi:transposase [Mesorhizobium caraganae]|uniref:transposase n=1 Tax=Mesorhizobium caraganae TaxID=483206 RepID=UPI00406AB018
MDEALGASKGERTSEQLGYRSGYYGRTLVTRVGKLELRVPQDRAGRFSTELFERYQRSERALVATLAEMYLLRVSTRKVKAITEELCAMPSRPRRSRPSTKRLDESLKVFAERPLQVAFCLPHPRCSLREGARGRHRHEPGGADRGWHRLGRPACLQELRWLYDRRDLAEAKADLAAWLSKWSARYPRLTTRVEETIEYTLTFLPSAAPAPHLKSTNMLERLNEEIRRRTYVVRIFPNSQSCLRLVRALAVETNENWMEANRYINMDDPREHKKLALRQAA